MENSNKMAETIQNIIEKRGISVLTDQNLFCAILDDVIPLASTERTIVRRCLDKTTASNLIELYSSDNDKQVQLFNIINQYLKDNLGVSEEWRMIFINAFSDAFSCQYTFPVRRDVDSDHNTSTQLSENNKLVNDETVSTKIDFSRYRPGIIGVGSGYIVGLKSNGTVLTAGDNSKGQCNTGGWKNVTAISARSYQTVGLLADGTVVETGSRYDNADVSMVRNWKDMVAVCAGDNHIIAIRKNGKPFGCGANQKGQCDVLPWNNIIDIAAGYYHTIGLKKDGSVVAVGENKNGECDVSNWKNIKAIAVGPSHSVGVREDGTVVATGKNDYGECDVQDWKQIIAVKACQRHTMGLKADGTVIVTGEHTDGKYDVSGWTDIVSIGIYFKPAGWGDIKVTLAGVQSNGSVRVAGDIDYGQNEAENWILFDSTITNKNISQNSIKDNSIDGRTKEIKDEIEILNKKLSLLKGPFSVLKKKSIEEKISELKKKLL